MHTCVVWPGAPHVADGVQAQGHGLNNHKGHAVGPHQTCEAAKVLQNNNNNEVTLAVLGARR